MKTIPLSKGHVAMVDDVDYHWLSQWKWHQNRGYACRQVGKPGRKSWVWMHREILRPKSGQECDHINGNGLDNRRSNLRLATHQENGFNRRKLKQRFTSRFKGTHLHKQGWRATIDFRVGGKKRNYHIGYYKTEEQAARAYDETAKELFGQFAALNFPEKTK